MTMFAQYFKGIKHEKDGVHFSGGKPYLFDGNFGGNWGVAYNGYRIVEIDDKGSVKTFQLDGSLGTIVNESVLS